MKKIEASGYSFNLGSDSRFASDDEKPVMRVGFTYNYWIDSSEVTIGKYQEITGCLPEEYSNTEIQKDLPICNVSWYDAILFCNERSKMNDLDTVYTYSKIERSGSHVYDIANLAIDLSKEGFRLPTESEWEFAARATINSTFPWGNEINEVEAQKQAWFSANSNNKIQRTCGLLPNHFGLYDMLGNALEWVNDLKGTYVERGVNDFVGSGYSYTGERSVKGGSFKHPVDKLRYSSRKDEYATISSTVTEYLGFRCCIGPITNPTYSYEKINDHGINPIQYLRPPIVTKIGKKNAKIVFVNKSGSIRTLCYTDFNEAIPRVHQFFDIQNTFLPTISPDGKWVAFCTKQEGFTENSIAYVRKLDYEGSGLIELPDKPAFVPRWWVDPVGLDTFIVYTNSGIDNTRNEWMQTATKMQKFSNGVFVGAPLVLESNGSYHGGCSKNGKYLATGYKRLLVKNKTTNEMRTLFVSPQNGKVDEDTSQVCNVSITPDTLNNANVLFLDFGCFSKPSTITGSRYKSHEILFIGNYAGDIINWYRCPPGYHQWDNPEWSNNNRFAVASALPESNPDMHTSIFLINLENSEYTELIRGEDLYYPYMWISENDNNNNPEDLNLDSLGYYNDPKTHAYQRELSVKMPDFWKYRDSIEVLFLGSSRMQDGAVPKLFRPNFAYNLSYAGCGILGIKNLLKEYVLLHCTNLKCVAISIDICWYNKPNGDNSWSSGMCRTKGYNYDKNHEFWHNGIPQNFSQLISLAPNPVNPKKQAAFGWFESTSEGWGENPAITSDNWNWTMDNECLSSLNILNEIVSDCEERGINIVGVIFPQSPHYKNTPYFGMYGPTWGEARKILEKVKEIGDNYDSFTIYDAYMDGNHDYTDEDAHNESHLSAKGAVKFSTRLDSIIDSMLLE